ncbi:hypothetical protein QVD17_20544 [Tagetes erecta]|uniref:Transposase (putative) gypsy type domain-containing protein n=1 Tax=Tagetes erecta TaxID=13708 RepID=A0AAD8KLP4_TARER|nr:hypothetical protein QVD17_20544 [Tagetes erecta]
MPKHYISHHYSKLDQPSLDQFCLQYSITSKYKPTLPQPDQLITDCPDGYIALYTKHFEFSNLRIPFSIFFLSFLKAYRLNISQLSPFGAIKVTHFEIMCRALGGEPSLPLFHQFFQLSHHIGGDWYTVRNRRGVDLSCLLWISKTKLVQWQDHFFWVSADCIPFEMHWRQHHEPMDVILPDTQQFDKEMYSLLVKHPTFPQQFPEHVLVMTGLSRNWPYANVEPLLKEGDEEMGLLKYIKRQGFGAMLTTRDLREDELNILDRTQGIRYEGGLSHVEQEVEEGDVSNAGGGCVEIVVGMEDVMEKKEALSEGLYSKRMKFGNMAGSNVEVISVYSENSESFGDDTTSCGCKNGKKLVFTESSEWFDEAVNDALMPDVHGMQMVAVKTVRHEEVVQALQKELEDARTEAVHEKPYLAAGASKNNNSEMGLLKYIDRKGHGATEVEGDDVEMPKETVLEGPNSKRRKLVKGESSTVSTESSESDEADDPKVDDHDLDQLGGLEQVVEYMSAQEILKWHEIKAKKEARLVDQIARYRVQMRLQHEKNMKLSKKVRKLEEFKRMTLDKEKEAMPMPMVGVNRDEHEKAVQALQNELANARAEAVYEKEKMKQATNEFEEHKETVEKLNKALEVYKEMVEKLNGELDREKECRGQELVFVSQWLIQEGFEYVINRLHKSGEYNRLLGAVQTKLWSSGAHYGVVAGYAHCKNGGALKDVSLYKREAHQEFLKAVHELEHTRFPYIVALSKCAERTLDELRALEPMEMEGDEDVVGAYFLDKGSEAMQMVAVNTVKHEEVVQALQKELEDARAEAVHEKKLKQAHEEIKVLKF